MINLEHCDDWFYLLRCLVSNIAMFSYAIFIVIFLYFPIYSYRQDMTFRNKSDDSSDFFVKIISC